MVDTVNTVLVPINAPNAMLLTSQLVAVASAISNTAVSPLKPAALPPAPLPNTTTQPPKTASPAPNLIPTAKLAAPPLALPAISVSSSMSMTKESSVAADIVLKIILKLELLTILLLMVIRIDLNVLLVLSIVRLAIWIYVFSAILDIYIIKEIVSVHVLVNSLQGLALVSLVLSSVSVITAPALAAPCAKQA